MAKKNSEKEVPEQGTAVYRPAYEKIPGDEVSSVPVGPKDIDGDQETAKSILAKGQDPVTSNDPTQPEAGPYGPDANYVDTKDPGVQAKGAGSSETPEAFKARKEAEEKAAEAVKEG